MGCGSARPNAVVPSGKKQEKKMSLVDRPISDQDLIFPESEVPSSISEAVALESVPIYEINHIYGRNGAICQKVSYTSAGDIIYAAGSAGVILDSEKNQQKFFGGNCYSLRTLQEAAAGKAWQYHNREITGIAVSCDKKFVASAQAGKTPIIYLWSAISGKKISESGEKLSSMISLKPTKNIRAIQLLDFSPDNHFLCVVDPERIEEDKKHPYVLVIFDLSTGNETYRVNVSCEEPTAIAWSKKRMSKDICVAGKPNSLVFYNVEEKTTQDASIKGVEDITSVIFNFTGMCFTGNETGTICCWEKKEKDQYRPCKTLIFFLGENKAPITCLNWALEMLIAANRKGIVALVDDRLEKIGDFTATDINSSSAAITSVDLKKKAMLISTADGKIRELLLSSMKIWETRKTLDSPSSPINFVDIGVDGFITVSENNQLQTWDPGYKIPLFSEQLKENVSAVSINPNNGNIALGFSTGKVQIRHSVVDLGRIVCELSDSSPVESLIFSKDGSLLAVARKNHSLILYEIKGRTYTDKGKIAELSSSQVFTLIFSKDNKFIRAGYGLLDDQKEKISIIDIGKKAIASEENSQGLPTGAEAKGITYDIGKDGLIIYGDINGLLHLYKMPKLKSVQGLHFRAHGDKVNSVKISNDENWIISAGHNDGCVVAWKKKA